MYLKSQVPRPREKRAKGLFRRYHLAQHYCEGKDVLEKACGVGQGLGGVATRETK